MIQYTVKKQEDGKTVERILLANFNIERNALFKALRKKDVKINRKRISENIHLKHGDLIEAYVLLKEDTDLKRTEPLYKIIYQNEFILIVDKMQGIPVSEDSNRENSLIKQINSDFSSNYELCHRIDRNTGGLVIISKNRAYTQNIKDAINDRYYTKIYKCIVSGDARGIIGIKKAWHFKDRANNCVYIYGEKKKYSKEIITEIKKAEYNPKNNTTSLEINLITGRTHQIRAHLAFLGFPIIGDGKYGYNDINRHFDYKFQMLWACALIPDNTNPVLFKILPNQIISTEPRYE